MATWRPGLLYPWATFTSVLFIAVVVVVIIIIIIIIVVVT